MAENNISLAQGRGNFLTWCISGYMPLTGLCKPLYVAQALETSTMELGQYYTVYSVKDAVTSPARARPSLPWPVSTSPPAPRSRSRSPASA